ncbi:MAG: sugar phosphate nucleotidyltransferase, partial [Patescibacteria group bacterium]
SDARRFGVAEIERGHGKDTISVVSIEEKPRRPKSDFAVTGCYIYDNRCFDIIRALKPSGRGELEITDLSKAYMEMGLLRATILKDEWIDAGTFESLFRAATVVRQRTLDAAEKATTAIARKQPQKPRRAAARW